MSNFLIYGFLDPFTKELKYVGQSSRGLAEPKQYFKPSVRKQRRIICSWIESIFRKGSKPEIWIIEENIESIDKLNELEEFYIDYYRFIGCELKNQAKGGKSRIGFKHTEETKKKISRAAKRPCTEAAKIKIGIANSVNRMTPEHNNKLQIGKNKYIEQNGNPLSHKIMDQYGTIYSSKTEAARKIKVDRHRIEWNIQNKLSDVKGFIFKRISNG